MKVKLFILFMLLAVCGRAFDNPRLGLVISKTSFDQKWGVTQMSAHGWAAAANLAGIPYDCFFLEELTTSDLRAIDALILGQCSHVAEKDYAPFAAKLKEYLAGGGHLIVDGQLAVYDEKAAERDHAELDELAGIAYQGFRGNENFRLQSSGVQHYITRIFTPGQFVTQHLVSGLNILSGSQPLIFMTDGRSAWPFLSISEKAKSRIVLVSDFSTWSGAASFFRNEQPQLFFRNQLFNAMIRAIHWSLYGDISTPFPVPQLSNANLTAIVRLDGDGSSNLNEQITTINYLIDIARASGVVPVYTWVSSQAAKAGWPDLAPLGKKLEEAGGEIGTHSRHHRIDEEMTEERWQDELDGSIRDIEFNTSDYGFPIGKVECFINPGNTIKMVDYEQVAKRFKLYMTHGFEQDMPLGFGNLTWFTGPYKDLALLEDTPSPDYQWFYDPTWSYTTQQITAYQEAVFDHMFENIGRGVIYNQMWHDYSITSQPQYGKSRVVNKSNLAMYEAIRAKFAVKDIYCPAPIELANKLRLMARWNYRWSTSGEKIVLELDLSEVGSDELASFAGGMGVSIENAGGCIQEVTINGKPHDAFRDRLVILPDLGKGVNRIEVTMGAQKPARPRLTYISQHMASLLRTGDQWQLPIVTKNRTRFRWQVPAGYALLHADAQEWDRLGDGSLYGHADSDRTVVLQKLDDERFAISRATLPVEKVISEKKRARILVRSNGRDENTFSFRAGSAPQKITFQNQPAAASLSGKEQIITLPKFDGEAEIQIQF
ncbi:MAG TPA: hypothetical protein PLO28_03820 [bacterium]|nr:hypothetical protein [bacterium]